MRRIRDVRDSGHRPDIVARVPLESPAFGKDGAIPRPYTEDGRNVSPPLAWSRLPDGCKSVAIIMDDPDAPKAEPWVHWIIYNIPAGVGLLPEAVSPVARPPEVPGATQGYNDFGRIGYGGAAPPHGHGTHHYHFTIYAMDTVLHLPHDKVTKSMLLQAMKNHVLGFGELIGTYGR